MAVRRNHGGTIYPLLWSDKQLQWFLRDRASLMTTRFGCGIGLCCTCIALVEQSAVGDLQPNCRKVENLRAWTDHRTNHSVENPYRLICSRFVQQYIDKTGSVLEIGPRVGPMP